MSRSILPMLLLLFLAASCGKGELDPATLTNNPFDADYNGPTVYEVDTTYQQIITGGSAPVVYQVIAFRVKEELFLGAAAYFVQVFDPGNGLTSLLSPNPANSDHFTYSRLGATVGIPVCLDLRLFNDQSAARAEEICATLQ